MRDPWGLNEKAFARWYPVVTRWSEDAGQRETRARLVAQASGRTLEIGAGSGHNLPHYPASVTELQVRRRGRVRTCLINCAPPSSPRLRRSDLGSSSGPAPRACPSSDSSFDTVVATFVHCTIPDPLTAMNEIARVLRPDGRYLFIEHVRSTESTMLARFQDAVEIPHRYICAGCYPNRRTEELLRGSGLCIERVDHVRMPRAFPSVRPTIVGTARPTVSAPRINRANG